MFSLPDPKCFVQNLITPFFGGVLIKYNLLGVGELEDFNMFGPFPELNTVKIEYFISDDDDDDNDDDDNNKDLYLK